MNTQYTAGKIKHAPFQSDKYNNNLSERKGAYPILHPGKPEVCNFRLSARYSSSAAFNNFLF